MGYDLRFVDQVSASPTVRLDLMAAPWGVQASTDFGLPELRRSVVSTLLVDGDRYPAAAYGGRLIVLVARVEGVDDDETAAALQQLYRELDRPSNILRYRPDTTEPVFFRTFRSGPDSVTWDPFTKEVRAAVPAEPFALGLRETLPAVTVYNDPAEGTTLNANPNFDVEGATLNTNPYFETSAANWTATGGTAARSTVQFHEGVASLLLTPDGVTATVEARSENVPGVVVGQPYAVSAWVRCAVARNVNANIVWRDSGGVFLSSAGAVSFALAAGTWTPIEMIGTAPASAAQAQISVLVGSTPPGSHTLHIDEAKLQPASAAPWTAVGGTVARSTAQLVTGLASLLLTPDGVTVSVEARSENVPATSGQQWRSSAWVRCAVARSVFVGIIWRDSGGVPLATDGSTVSVSATTWTLIDTGALTAPVGTASAQIIVGMGSTPPAGHTLHIDEARIRQAGGAGGMSFDVTSPKGDVEAPLYLSVRASDVARVPESPGTGRRQSVIAVRRGGTPSAMPSVVQAESMTAGTDTSVQPASGSSGTFLRTTFATSPSLQTRASASSVPSSPSTDARGTYRTFVRCRKSVSTDTVQMQMRYINAAASVLSDLVTVPEGTVWRWVDMGLVQMPLGYDPVVDGLSGTPLPAAGVSVHLRAARVAGSGNLDIDAVMFAPADDRLCLVKWPEFSSETAYVVDSTAGQAYGVGASGEVRSALAELIGGPPMVTPGVANRVWMWRDVSTTYDDGDDVTATMQVTPYYWPRYLHVRPVAS